jgi:hypothetical protein
MRAVVSAVGCMPLLCSPLNAIGHLFTVVFRRIRSYLKTILIYNVPKLTALLHLNEIAMIAEQVR